MLQWQKIIFPLAACLMILPAYADDVQAYNCLSDSDNFNVSVYKDSDGTWCKWGVVRTGVTTPVGGYQPRVAVLNTIKFQLDEGVPYNQKNCTPISYDDNAMKSDGNLGMACYFTAPGAKSRPQTLNYDALPPKNASFELQQYENGAWVAAGEFCEHSKNCRLAIVSQQ